MMQVAFLIACGLLLVGFVVRARVRVLHVLFIPASVVAGGIGFGLVQLAQWWITDATPPPPWAAALAGAATEWRSWPGWLIAVVFAGMLLERPAGTMRQSLKKAAAAGIFAWFIIVGQIVLGLAVAWLVLERWGVPRLFGQLLEVSWAGGFASANAWGEVYRQSPAGFADARDLATFFAAMGILWGVVSGIVLVNIAVRRGWTRPRSGQVRAVRAVLVSGLEQRANPLPAAYARVGAQVIDPLVFQGLILAAALLVGIGLKWLTAQAGHLSGQEQVAKALGDLPLFLFALLGGWIVRLLMQGLGIADLIDAASLKRLTAAAMEFLIVAALASMRVSALAQYKWAALALMAVGAVWCIVCLLWIARRMLPASHWFELGLLNYGMATATTAQGLLLLRIIDQDLESGAAEEYALAAPLSAPFIGGGVITFSLPLVLEGAGVGWAIVAGVIVMAALYVAGRSVSARSAAVAPDAVTVR